jgi:hypothetical protein
MKIRTVALVAFVMLAPVGTGQAQLSNPLKFTLYGGAALPINKTQDVVRTGFSAGGAVDYKLPLLPFGVRGEVIYSNFEARNLTVTGARADVSEFGGNLNFVSWVPTLTAGLVRPYLTGGPSYSRLEESPTGGPGQLALNRWGFNLGVGVHFSIGALGARIDARYRQLARDPDDWTYIPVTVGITF